MKVIWNGMDLVVLVGGAALLVIFGVILAVAEIVYRIKNRKKREPKEDADGNT